MAQSKMKKIPGEISDEEENYMRLQLLRRLIEKMLREEFYKTFSRDPGTLFTQLQVHKNKIDKLLEKGIIGHKQSILLLPECGCFVYSEKFDVSLLVILLRNFCGYSYTKNWTPKKNDISVKANIYHCLQVRNKIQHSPAAVEKKEMNEIFGQIEQPLLDLGADEKEFDGLKYVNIMDRKNKDAMKKLQETSQKFQYGCQTPVNNFFSRENELQELHHKMKESMDEDNFANNKLGVAICGMGGVGKSQLARQYWKIHQGNFFSDNCIWINGQSKESMENDFQTIGERCGLTNIKNSDGSFKKLADVVYWVYVHFMRRENNSLAKKVLFVFDNIEDQEDLETFLPPSNYAPYILVTSQCTEWDKRFDVLKLSVFSKDNAFQFVKENLKRNTIWNTEDCGSITYLLGYHPLALQQALSYVNKAKISLKEYIDLFKKQKEKMLSTPTNDLQKNSIYMVLSLSIERIEKLSTNDISLDLLYIMSVLDGKSMQKELLLKFCNNDLPKLIDTLNLMCKYSIINDSDSDEPILIQTINIHSLTQSFLQNHKQEEHMLSRTIQSIDTVLNKEKMNYEETRELIIAMRWYHHFLHILENIKKDHVSYCLIGQRIAFFLANMGKHGEALKIYQEVERTQKQVIGDHHPDYLTNKQNLASCLDDMGNYGEALKIYQDVERTQKQVIGDHHPDYLTTKNNLAFCFWHMGNYDKALKILQEVERTRKTVIGDEHPDYLITKNYLSLCLYDMGNYGKVLKICQELQTIQKKVIGDQHPDYLRNKHNLASCYQQMCNYSEALKIYHEVETIQKQVIGNQHPDYLNNKTSLASCYRQMCNYSEALKIYQEVETIQKQVIGNQHPHYLKNKTSLASCYRQMCNYSEALKIYQEVETIQKQVIGNQHPHYLKNKTNLASCLYNMGNYGEALMIYQEVKRTIKKVIGDHHPDYLATKHNIASCLYRMGNYGEALKIYQEVETTQKKVIGDQHPDYLTTKNSIASCLDKMGNCGEALKIYQEVETTQKKVIGDQHPDYLTTKHSIASCLDKMGNYGEALKIYQEVETIRKQVIGDQHPDYLTTKHNIASCLDNMGNYGEALKIYQEVETTQKKVIGDQHPDYLTTKRNIALCRSAESCNSL